MKTRTINVYSFDELNEKAKNRAIEKLHDINTDFDWWEFVYEDFKSICDTIGIDADLKSTYFTLSYSQSDSAGFTAEIDLFKLIEGIEKKTYLEYAPNLETENRFNPSPCPVDKRVLNLVGEDIIDVDSSFYHKSHCSSNWTKLKFDYNFNYGICNNYNNIEKECSKLEEWIEEIGEDLSSLLYNLLRAECDYQSSKEAIIETIKANDYEFDKDGNMI